MFKQIRSWIIRRKFNALMAVADTSIDAVEARAQLNVALCAATYRDIVSRFAEDTQRDPMPLLHLMSAIERAVEHYRPGFEVALETASDKLRDIDESPLMTRLLRAVDAAIAELRRD